MLNYTSSRQISIEEFETPFRSGLDPNNRWVRLSQLIPWDELVAIYARSLSVDFGRPTTDARVEIGALIIQHILGLTDEELIEQIRENPYLQYFLGYSDYSYRRVFDPSLLVRIRKRLGEAAINEMNEVFLSYVESSKVCGVESGSSSELPRDEGGDGNDNGDKISSSANGESTTEDEATGLGNGEGQGGDDKGDGDQDSRGEEPLPNSGKLLVDATVAPCDIKYPTDLELLNEAREHSERLIDKLWEPGKGKVKPRTYRRKARQAYLSVAKQRKKRKRVLRKAIGQQLRYLRRNLATIDRLLDEHSGEPFPLSYRDLRILWVIREVYRQQKEMYDERKYRIADRIVSIHQPYIRPIVRGKAKGDVEFGPKLSVSLVKGYCYLERISWDAFHEGGDLMGQVENFKRRFGHYPEVVIADKIYGTRENRAYLKERGIRFSGVPLGRPPVITEENAAEIKAEKKRRQQEARIRSWIEGAFGRGKRGYGLDLIKTKTKSTSETYVAAVFFAMNIVLALKAHFFAFWCLGSSRIGRLYKAMGAILSYLRNIIGIQRGYVACRPWLAPTRVC